MSQSVLINEKIADTGIELLSDKFDVTVMPGWSDDELRDRLGSFDGVVIRSATKLTSDLLEHSGQLKVIGRAGVGVDNVDLDAASRRGILVVNAPTSTVMSAAEHTLGLMFALARNIPQGDATMKAGEWARGRLGGVELAGKTLAVLGLGRIGQIVAERARALEMRVVGYDPFVARERFTRMGVEYAETPEEALAQGDFVTLHLPMTPETRNMISADQLALMPTGSRLVNCARGGLLDLDALQQALESGHLAGAALDVYPTEPPPPHAVFDHPNIVLTPHLAASTREAQDRAGVAVAEQVSLALTGGVVTAAVNIPTIGAESVAALQPFVPLAGQLGRLASQLAGSPNTRLSVRALGGIAEYDVRMLSYGALISMLSGSTDDPVTFVNARSIAETRGIAVEEGSDPQARDYQDLLQVEVDGTRSISVCGTTIGADDRSWLTSALGYDIDIELTKHMAFFEYADVPGMIGRVGTAFGTAGVNIANMAVARRGGTAFMAISFDTQPPTDLVDAISASDDFEWAAVVQL